MDENGPSMSPASAFIGEEWQSGVTKNSLGTL